MRGFRSGDSEAARADIGGLPGVRVSIRRKLMLMVLAVTLTSLSVMATAMVVFDLRTYHTSLVNDLLAQADLLGRASVAALAFDDAKVARENLGLLKVSPKITAAAIYTANGKLFASYLTEGAADTDIPAAPEAGGYRTDSNSLTLFQRINGKSEVLGTVYLKARYELRERLINYVLILSVVLALSLLLALWMSSWLQGTVTQPILAITAVARQVMTRRDFSLRVNKTTEDEVGFLVDTFNTMLSEVGQRSHALEESHRSLQHEIQVRLAAEESLRLADRRKDEFLATLAHELRNPMAPMSNALAILRAARDPNPDSQAARGMMERQLRQLVRLVDDLLDVSRITTGKIELKSERVELKTVIHSAVETALPMIESRKHQLEVSLPPQAIYLQADATRLSQVFQNLLNNASKFTAIGGNIGLSAVLDEAGELVVTVSDNGVGLAPEKLPLIFEMFMQVDRSLERTQAGLGVGLSLSRHLVGMHGGTIVAASAGTGLGSSFSVHLPVAEAAGPEAAAAPATAVADDTSASYRVLLADDNEDFTASFAVLLRALGHEVQVTDDGEAALTAADAFIPPPDFAFLDIGLPLLNGYELAQRLRALPGWNRTTLVAVTGWGQDDDRQRSRAAGFDHHLVKPVELGQILAIFET